LWIGLSSVLVALFVASIVLKAALVVFVLVVVAVVAVVFVVIAVVIATHEIRQRADIFGVSGDQEDGTSNWDSLSPDFFSHSVTPMTLHQRLAAARIANHLREREEES
jgi:hypothetical protein